MVKRGCRANANHEEGLSSQKTSKTHVFENVHAVDVKNAMEAPNLQLGRTKPQISGTVPAKLHTTSPNDSGPVSATINKSGQTALKHPATDERRRAFAAGDSGRDASRPLRRRGHDGRAHRDPGAPAVPDIGPPRPLHGGGSTGPTFTPPRPLPCAWRRAHGHGLCHLDVDLSPSCGSLRPQDGATGRLPWDYLSRLSPRALRMWNSRTGSYLGLLEIDPAAEPTFPWGRSGTNVEDNTLL